ncbi:hypothetical protein [Natronococcus wangiae]|uniref:hypothetical protein n=1 Tax=Natronococcus wangiae TaxID=3068275 RepID=UPI00273F977B|nr:hypothetical protein [Natronococcus sp. AD5]
MNRRTLLKRGGIGVAAVVAVSGCTEETLEEAETNPPFLDDLNEEELELPVNQQMDVVEGGVLRAENARIENVGGFEAYLEEQGVSVEELSETEKTVEEKLEIEREDVEIIENEPHGEETVLELEYVQSDRTETGSLYAIGVIAGGYASLVGAEYDAELLEATILDESLRSFATFDVLASWAGEYNEGITTAREYGNKPRMSTKSE